MNKDNHENIDKLTNQSRSLFDYSKVIDDDQILEAIGSFTEYIPMIRSINSIVGVSQAVQKSRLARLLKSGGQYLGEDVRDPKVYEKFIKRLGKAMEKRPQLKEVSLNFLDKVTQSYSEKIASIMGVYLGKVIITEGLEEKQSTAVIIQALTTLNDFDLEHFKNTYSFLKAQKYGERKIPRAIYYKVSDVPDTNDSAEDQEGIEMLNASLQKLDSIQLFTTINAMSGGVAYGLNTFSLQFHHLLESYEEMMGE